MRNPWPRFFLWKGYKISEMSLTNECLDRDQQGILIEVLLQGTGLVVLKPILGMSGSWDAYS